MPRVLLYSPDVVGHPRVYCRTITDALSESQCDLVIAMGFSEAESLEESPDLRPLQSRPRVRIVDTKEFSAGGRAHLTAEEMVVLQERFRVEATLFIEADKSNTEFVRMSKRKAAPLLGRNIGIFANTAEWYPGEDSFSGERRTLIAPTLRTTLGNCKRAVFNRRQTARYFFEKTVLARGVLDEIWVKDERLAHWRGRPVFWMPEISRPVATVETSEEELEYRKRQAELTEFVKSNAGRDAVLYFGDAAHYKGYDLFLEFVLANQGTYAIHAGRSCDAREKALLRPDIDTIRQQLRDEGRLLETQAYIHTQRLKELYFGAVRLYITTHRLTLSSSSVIQALELGRPVLVPDRGLLGYRVRTNGLGSVYRYGDLGDLAEQARRLWKSDLSRFIAPAARFWARFSDDAIREFLVDRLIRT